MYRSILKCPLWVAPSGGENLEQKEAGKSRVEKIRKILEFKQGDQLLLLFLDGLVLERLGQSSSLVPLVSSGVGGRPYWRGPGCRWGADLRILGQEA